MVITSPRHLQPQRSKGISLQGLTASPFKGESLIAILVTFVYLYKSNSVIHQNADTRINEEGKPDHPSGPATRTPRHQALHPVPRFRSHRAGKAIANLLFFFVY